MRSAKSALLLCLGLAQLVCRAHGQSCLSDCVLETAIGPAVALFFLFIGCIGILSCAVQSYRNSLPEAPKINSCDSAENDCVPNQQDVPLSHMQLSTDQPSHSLLQSSEIQYEARNYTQEPIPQSEIFPQDTIHPQQIGVDERDLEDRMVPQKLEFPAERFDEAKNTEGDFHRSGPPLKNDFEIRHVLPVRIPALFTPPPFSSVFPLVCVFPRLAAGSLPLPSSLQGRPTTATPSISWRRPARAARLRAGRIPAAAIWRTRPSRGSLRTSATPEPTPPPRSAAAAPTRIWRVV